MTDRSLDELGPVDFVIIEFPEAAQNFSGETIDELLKLCEAGIIRVIDILILVKDGDGSIEAIELADLEDLGELEQLEAELAELLAEDDIVHLAAAMDPGSTAGVVVYENLWAAPFAAAASRAGGQLIADGRIPIQAIIASIEADEEAQENDMPVRRTRAGRRGVVAAPVAKTAVVAKAVTPGPCAGREGRGRGLGRQAGTTPATHLSATEWPLRQSELLRRRGGR